MRLIDADKIRYLRLAEGIYAVGKRSIDVMPTIEPKPEYIDNSLIIKHYSNGMIAMNEECFKRLDSQPKRGEWIDINDEPYCKCSVCGTYIDNLDDHYSFCPHCGADMRGGENE